MMDKGERYIWLMGSIGQLIIFLCLSEFARIMFLWCTVTLVPNFIIVYTVGCKMSARMIKS